MIHLSSAVEMFCISCFNNLNFKLTFAWLQPICALHSRRELVCLFLHEHLHQYSYNQSPRRWRVWINQHIFNRKSISRNTTHIVNPTFCKQHLPVRPWKPWPLHQKKIWENYGWVGNLLVFCILAINFKLLLSRNITCIHRCRSRQFFFGAKDFCPNFPNLPEKTTAFPCWALFLKSKHFKHHFCPNFP